MAVQREIVDKDGNRLAVVQGGAGKSAVYGKTAEGEWVPLQVDADGRAVLNVGEVSATIGVIEQGAAGEDPWPVQINGRTEPQVTTLLTDTPLGAGANYTQTGVDSQEYEFPNGSKGIVSVSGLARADKQGTLYLEASDDGTNWVRAASSAVNQTGVGRLRRTNLFTRYFRFRFINGGDAQTSFALHQTVWQTTDGQGDEHGEGADSNARFGSLAANTSETVLDLRSACEMQEVVWTGDSELIKLEIAAYKDSGAVIPMATSWSTAGTTFSTGIRFADFASRIVTILETDAKHDPGSGKYAARLKTPMVFAKGFLLKVVNTDTDNAHNTGVYVACRIL